MKKKLPPLGELGPFQILILVLSLFVLALLGVELLFELPEETRRVVRWIDNTVCGLFFIEFLVRFRRAPSKLEFMKWGWIDLLASIPEVEALRWGRLFRVFRILRMLRAVKSIRRLFAIFALQRTQSGVASVFTITFLVLSLATVGILATERTPEANIHSAEDAVWWSITTVTTVGYGDRYPVTTGGRFIAAALMFTGVGLFGTLSGVIASFFLGGKTNEDEPAPDAVLLEKSPRWKKKSPPCATRRRSNRSARRPKSRRERDQLRDGDQRDVHAVVHRRRVADVAII